MRSSNNYRVIYTATAMRRLRTKTGYSTEKISFFFVCGCYEVIKQKENEEVFEFDMDLHAISVEGIF